ncbi:hypothetical protein NZ698_04420 [Chryseobacterium sp. PBS4-4]|uniref:Trimeric autotransporter adhesin YadA-like head domain-containing protein n=1 Tax=Chryseobacterium edaphi TaxID=2976532 RepID=A0ABT2W2I2_9FLAO|nr:hypothetical protein [Chryseobacterium edaphi]MCU7616432.1 hypothetical protein [Chryseobacterium edaphi]
MNNNLLLISLLSVFSINKIQAQVGIGTATPHSSAILQLNDPKKGLLLTSIALTSISDATTIPSPATGLLIWNNGTGGLSPTGFYYWNTGQWNYISPGNSTSGGSSGTGWTTGGNAGSYAGSNTTMSFGTTTYDDLVFKVNNIIAGRLGVNNSVQFGTGSSAAQDASAIGYNSAAAGYQSLAMGYNAKTTSNSETALGFNAQTSNQNSTALGSGSKGLGQNSIALGYNSQTNAYNSTALGSGSNAGAQNATAIGYGATTNQANAIVLGDSSANVGIGTSTPNTNVKIDVNGQYKLGEKGSVHKNQISFNQYPSVSISNLGVGATTTLNIPIPSGFEPSSTKATIIVTPAGDFLGTTFAISNPRLSSTNNVVINLTNISSSTASLNSAQFYVTINEF